MINKIDQRLLTKHPLIWNTRIIWILILNLVFHLFFYISGYVSVSAPVFKYYQNEWSVGGAGAFSFSVLCSLLVMIVWLIYFLRNNAFKHFYRIGRWHLAAETAIIFIIIYSSITFIGTFNAGVRAKTRSITGIETFRNELNTANNAIAFIPQNRTEYFYLNNCDHIRKQISYSETIDYFDTSNFNYHDTNWVKIRAALARPDAFSYSNYCGYFVSYFQYTGRDTAETLASKRNRWIAEGRKDSIKAVLAAFFQICDKYGISYRLNADTLVTLVFAGTQNKPLNLIPSEEFYRDELNNVHPNPLYFNSFELRTAFSFIDDALPNEEFREERNNTRLVFGYVALSLTIFLLCYRRFSRKVFLIGIVGTIVWAIIVGLLTINAGTATGFAVFCIILFLSFGTLGWAGIQSNSSKTASGSCLTWHAFMAPFFVMLIMLIINDYYDSRPEIYVQYDLRADLMREKYPFSYWVSEHPMEILTVNLFLVLIYIAFVFNKWTRKWQAMPEE
jgi:hypothetical protein